MEHYPSFHTYCKRQRSSPTRKTPVHIEKRRQLEFPDQNRSQKTWSKEEKLAMTEFLEEHGIPSANVNKFWEECARYIFQTTGLVKSERQNRKLLEQLEEQKKRLRGIPTHHGSAVPNATSPGAAAVISSVPVPLPPQINPISSTLISETQHMTPAQRAALQHANANSVGFFITQDSSFGNLILPVLPRFEK